MLERIERQERLRIAFSSLYCTFIRLNPFVNNQQYNVIVIQSAWHYCERRSLGHITIRGGLMSITVSVSTPGELAIQSYRYHQ